MAMRHRSYHVSRYHQNCTPLYCERVVSSHAEAPMQNSDSFHPSMHTRRTLCFNAIAAGVLITGLVGCGAPSSDTTSDFNSRATATHSTDVGAERSGQDFDRGARVGGGIAENDQSGQHDESTLDHLARTPGKIDDSIPPSTPSIPDTIAKDLSSSNPRARHDALDYWETKGTHAPLDPVFDAMEDEDPAVRAKATAIIEQRWAEEEVREKG